MAVGPKPGPDLAGMLNILAGNTSGVLWGADYAASAAWPAINGHGALPSQLDANGNVQWSLKQALNIKAGTTQLGLNLVCNVLAGTTGLEAPLALRVYAGLP
jgi:hypothetical protein